MPDAQPLLSEFFLDSEGEYLGELWAAAVRFLCAAAGTGTLASGGASVVPRPVPEPLAESVRRASFLFVADALREWNEPSGQQRQFALC